MGLSCYTLLDGFVFYSNPIYKAKEYAPLKEEDVLRLKQLQNTNNFQVQQTQLSQKNTGKQQGAFLFKGREKPHHQYYNIQKVQGKSFSPQILNGFSNFVSSFSRSKHDERPLTRSYGLEQQEIVYKKQVYFISLHRQEGLALRCQLFATWSCSMFQELSCLPIKVIRELGSEHRKTVRSISGMAVRSFREPFLSTRRPERTRLPVLNDSVMLMLGNYWEI